jgi:glutamate N-acetyltransferase / amino-acid N-acetyltransferase
MARSKANGSGSCAPLRGGLSAVKGVRAAGVACGLKKTGASDLALVVADRPATVAAVFTRNLVQAAPVLLCKRHLRGGRFSAIVLNSGNANACTGLQGVRDAERTAATAAQALERPVQEVFVASTGVIGRRLDLPAVLKGVHTAVPRLSPKGGGDAARAIMTTDTIAKEAAVGFRIGRAAAAVGGMAKGSGMIAPNMGTMLSVIATDAAIPSRALQAALRAAVAESFNCITVDGDTSTNDTVLLFATGASGIAIDAASAGFRRFQEALTSVCQALAKLIVRDGEGATKLAEIRITGARSPREARLAAETVANSPLVKTTLFGEDINWGRLMMALGRSGARFDPARVDLFVDGLAVVRRGETRGDRVEAAANRRLTRREFTLAADLHAGRSTARIWTTDLSEAYVRINAGYRT